MKSVRWMASYILVACLGLWMAFFVSMKFMTPAHSQEAPTSGELPAEFMKDLENAPAAPAGQEPAPPQNAPPAAADQPIGDGATAAPPASQGLPGDDYVYDPTGKRDPFKPFKDFIPSKGAVDPAARSIDPLQRWDLDRLQVVGILWEVNRPRAMLRDPDGKVYSVLKNTKVGRNEGIVSAIREGEIVIVETFYVDGAIRKEARVLEFKK